MSAWAFCRTRSMSGYEHAVGFIKKLAEEKVRVVKPFEPGK